MYPPCRVEMEKVIFDSKINAKNNFKRINKFMENVTASYDLSFFMIRKIYTTTISCLYKRAERSCDKNFAFLILFNSGSIKKFFDVVKSTPDKFVLANN